MLRERRAAATAVATRLFALEEALDIAFAEAAGLAAAMPEARKSARLSAIVGQEAVASAADVVALLAEARGAVVTTHNRLDQTKTQIGLREMAFGDVIEKPKAEQDAPLETDLRLVS